MLPRRYGSGGLLARPASLLFGSPALYASGGGLAAAAALGLRPRHSGLGLRPFPFLSARAVVCAPGGLPSPGALRCGRPFAPMAPGTLPRSRNHVRYTLFAGLPMVATYFLFASLTPRQFARGAACPPRSPPGCFSWFYVASPLAAHRFSNTKQ